MSKLEDKLRASIKPASHKKSTGNEQTAAPGKGTSPSAAAPAGKRAQIAQPAPAAASPRISGTALHPARIWPD